MLCYFLGDLVASGGRVVLKVVTCCLIILASIHLSFKDLTASKTTFHSFKVLKVVRGRIKDLASGRLLSSILVAHGWHQAVVLEVEQRI